MSKMPTMIASAALVLVGCTGVTAGDGRWHRHGDADRVPAVVTATSHYGSASVSAPVRRNRHDRLEVRLPHGTWIECGRSCADTLRRETVDFWDNHTRQQGPDGPGYLRFEW